MQATGPNQSDYNRDGFLFPIDIMPASEAASLRQSVEEVEAASLPLPRPVSQYLRVNAQIVLPFTWDVIFRENIVNAVRAVLGENVLCWGVELFIKEPHSQKVVTWHQDLTYWGLGQSDGEVTAWLALSPATRESGCMRFVPGSHKNEIVPHNETYAESNLLSRGQEIAVDVDEASAVDVELQPGQMSLHHGRMFHSSGPNRSTERRIGFVMRFITPDMKPQHSEPDFAIPVCGKDPFGHFEYIPKPTENFSDKSLEYYERMLAINAKTQTVGAKKDVKLYG